MTQDLTLRPAEKKDLPEIVRLLSEDEFGSHREHFSNPLPKSYYEAFQEIIKDKNQSLLVLEKTGRIIGTCHLTFIPFLSFQGSWELNIDNIHIDKDFQGQGFGTWMLRKAIAQGQEKGCKVIKLMTNKKRLRAKKFYEDLGFKATHEGMKLYL